MLETKDQWIWELNTQSVEEPMEIEVFYSVVGTQIVEIEKESSDKTV